MLKWKSAYPKKVWLLAVVALLTLTGFSFIWPLTTLYVTRVLGKSLTTAGIVMSLEAAFGIAGSMLGGFLFDRFGVKGTLLPAALFIVLSNLLLAESRNWWVFLTAFLFMNLCNGVIFTSNNAAVGLAWPEGGRKPFNLLYVFQNIGVAVGTALGGVISSISFTISFLAIALMFGCVCFIVACGLTSVHTPSGHSSIKPEPAAHVLRKRMNSGHVFALGLLGLGSSFAMIGYIQWQTTMPVFMGGLGIPIKLYGFLWTLNGLLVILLQPLNGIIDKVLPKQYLQFVLGQLLFILSFSLIIWRGEYVSFVASMVLMTLGEIIIWPSVPAFASKIAPDGRKGMFQGLLNVFKYCGRLLGPILGTTLYQHAGPYSMFAAMIGCNAIALVLFLGSFYVLAENMKLASRGQRQAISSIHEES